MNYSKIEMAEQTVIPEGTYTTEEDPRLGEYTSDIFQKLTHGVPDLNPEQAAAILSVSQELAKAKLADQRRIEQLKTENAKLQQESDRDSYNPEIYSATGWKRVMKTKLAELKRNKQNAVIVAFDLDDFKEYNDTFKSHTEGDAALGLAGGLIKNAIRPTDIVARLHGDEFVALLVTELEGGVIAAARIGQAISEMSVLLKTSIPFSASIGIAQLSPEIINTDYKSDDNQLSEALKTAYSLADRTQYEGAKNVGKNKIGVMLSDGSIKTAIVQPGINGHPPIITYQEPTPVKS